jgi:uncharacterized protein with GYD domain
VSDESDVNGPGDPSSETDSGEIDPDLAEQMADVERAMAEARARLADVPVEVVVTNHVMGLYELAAIHLSSVPPDLHAASLAIDAVGCLVEGLGERLGDEHDTMRDALANIRMAFVNVKSQHG